MAPPNPQSPDAILASFARLSASSEQDLFARLDRESAEREKVHRAALAAAAVEHERVLRSAELLRKQFELDMEKMRTRQREEEQRELDIFNKEKAELCQEEARRKVVREIEEMRQKEVERKHAMEIQRLKSEAEEIRQSAERDRLADQRMRELALQKAQNQPKQPIPEVKSPVDVLPVINPPIAQISKEAQAGEVDREAEHKSYVDLHQRLKELRKFMLQKGKETIDLKKRMGDKRREIRACIGQLTEGKGVNKAPTTKIMRTLKEARADSGPTVDVSKYIISPTPGVELPGLFIYLINIFSKAVISQFINEASVAPKSAEPVGIIAVQVFSTPDFQVAGRSLIDILIAKFHVVCPVLWGIYGSDKTVAGRTRLGWKREEGEGTFVSEQRHSERMTGLGAGFASISLRNFARSPCENPYPNSMYWRSLAYIVNVPPQDASQTHFIVLKAMVENHEAQFLEFYGTAALAALRKALIDFPRQTKEMTVAASAVSVLPDVLKRDKNFTLRR
ncbi:MAG: hypothetical protein M1829_002622 [Trizodia sp. TS-e1964]|nr:MAG: hypothetical protein M1829_002622 [Trizodia sp. TS-e1964]